MLLEEELNKPFWMAMTNTFCLNPKFVHLIKIKKIRFLYYCNIKCFSPSHEISLQPYLCKIKMHLQVRTNAISISSIYYINSAIYTVKWFASLNQISVTTFTVKKFIYKRYNHFQTVKKLFPKNRIALGKLKMIPNKIISFGCLLQ